MGGALVLKRLEEEAQRLLQRIRRRAGIRDAGRGNHVNVPLAWTELMTLARCRGQVHQGDILTLGCWSLLTYVPFSDCLDTLILSLEQSSCSLYQIPVLFYLMETVLFWLQTEAVHQPHLRSAEIKLLKVRCACLNQYISTNPRISI